MAGAAYLATKACLRSGAGKVTLATDASTLNILGVSLPEALTCELRLSGGLPLSSQRIHHFLNGLSKASVLGIGCGLGVSPGNTELVKLALKILNIPMVIDADGLNSLDAKWLLQRAGGEMVLTPHDGEFRKLFGVELESNLKSRMMVAKRLSTKYHCVLLCKGHRTIVANPSGDVFVNSSGNAGMATGGTGDVLTGIITALIAQGFGAFDAACLGAHIHGSAADRFKRRYSMASLIAGDLIDELPIIFKYLEAKRSVKTMLKAGLVK
ncbi:MAG: hydroxyethylthiazole kinase-like uncharacterized protein yjeF [Candidatus Omnitrophota bacterium]|jgi:hydroxyethylthiazole kinase-like uncharacterized protein yjeF